MLSISNINVNDKVCWADGKGIQLAGIVVERVRAKSRPKLNVTSATGRATNKEVSFIVRHNRKLIWIDVDQVLVSATPSANEHQKKNIPALKIIPAVKTPAGENQKRKAGTDTALVQPIEQPFVPRPGMPKPPPFLNDFSSLLKYKPSDR